MVKVFIDGGAGTTGLVIRERLADYTDLQIITLPDELRKDEFARAEAMNSADVVFLCLPDAAAKEAVGLVTNPDTVIIDTSTAHRTSDEWTYGFAEIAGQREKIKKSKRIANPGCHASGFIALVTPLIEKGLMDKETVLFCFSLTGYTGGGKKMIAEYETDMPVLYKAPRQYGLSQAHKHIPEMMKITGITQKPCFCPIVAAFPRGMEVTVPITSKQIKGTLEQVKAAYGEYYKGSSVVKFVDGGDEGGFLSASALSGSDGMEISVFGNDDNMILVARFDNLGKGASGSAIQNMNIVLGIDETKGLNV